MAIERFEDIEAWQVGRNLTQLIYQKTLACPMEYRIPPVPQGTRDQIQQAVKTKSIICGFMRYLRNIAPRTCPYDS